MDIVRGVRTTQAAAVVERRSGGGTVDRCTGEVQVDHGFEGVHKVRGAGGRGNVSTLLECPFGQCECCYKTRR